MNTEDYEWLGIIYPVDVKANVAFITPLAYFDKIVWHAIKPDTRRQYFPNNGKATLFTKDTIDSKIGWFCTFFSERNPHLGISEDSPYSSLYMVNDELQFSSLAQIIDLTNKASEPFEIPDLLDRGFEPEKCFTQYVYIRHQDYLYGPIRLERHGDKMRPREYIEGTDTGGPSLLILKYRMPGEGILKLGEIVQTYNYLDEYFLETPVGKEDFSPPQVVIKRILQASKEPLTSIEGDVRLVDKRIRELARLSSSQGPTLLHIETTTLNRAQYILGHQLHRLNDLQALIDDLPADHPLFKMAREQEIRLRSAEIDTEIEEQTRRKREILQQLEQAIQEAGTRLEDIYGAVNAAKKQRDQAIEVEHEVQQRLAKLREEPLRMLAELQIASSFFPALARQGQSSRPLSDLLPVSNGLHNEETVSCATIPASTVIWQENTNVEHIHADIHSISNDLWTSVARQAGVQSNGVRVCVAALLAGLIPIIHGEVASAMMRAVARIIAGGRIWSIPVPLTATSPLDLFGSIERERRIFIPSAGGLADIVLEAQKHPQELALVVLEGIDRVPGLPVYVPLLRLYHESRQAAGNPSPTSPLNLFHPRAIDQQDPYRALAWFIWPDNLLLAVTSDNEAHSLPLPAICDSWLIPLKAAERKPGSDARSGPPAIFQVLLNQWHTWQQDVQRQEGQFTETVPLTGQRRVFYYALELMVKASKPLEIVAQIWPQLFDDEVSNNR